MIWLAAAAMAAPPAAAEVWTSAGVEARVSDPVGVGLTQNVRFGSGPARVNEVLTDLSGEVKLSDAWALQAAYRFGSKLDDDARLFAHRGTFDTKAGWDVGRLGLDWRERYQVRLPASGNDARHRIRSRLRASIDTDTRVTPRLAVELFLGLGDGNGTGDGVGLEKIRLDAGVKVKLKKKLADLSLLYRLEEPIRDREDFRLHVVVADVTFKIDLRRDDDDKDDRDDKDD